MKLFITLIAVFFSFAQLSHAQFVIIGNEDLPKEQLTIEEIRDIFSGETGTWDNGDKIRFSERKENTSYLMEFYKELGLHRTFFRRNRVKKVNEDPSRLGSIFKSDVRILTFVSETSGAIGVVSESAANLFSGPLKTIQIKSKSTAEDGSNAEKK
jgi:ABC-type phosphate transport system substrate-binding protein